MTTWRGFSLFAVLASVLTVGLTSAPASADRDTDPTVPADDWSLDDLAIDIPPGSNHADDITQADSLDAGEVQFGPTSGAQTTITQADPLDAGEVQFGPTSGAQTTITHADAWHDAGIDGTGIRIGVIDFFDVNKYWNEAEHGPTPVPGVTAMCLSNGNDCTASFFDTVSSSDDRHGVAVVEVIKDMAPGAQIYIARALTIADYHAVVDWFAAAGVTIVNRSLGSRYDGPGDGRGGINDLAAYAVTRGMAWINSGGNNGIGRYYRSPVRLVGDRVAFGPSGSDTFLEFNRCVSLGGVRWANDWDAPAAERTDYDIYIWDAPLGNPTAGFVVTSATDPQHQGAPPIENIGEPVCPMGTPGTRALYLEVRWRGGDPTGDVLEVLDYGDGIRNFSQTAQSATTGIADSNEPGVLAVGSIDPAAGGTIAPYSSQGPTNDGRLAPDISAPGSVASTIFTSGFAGTSVASPVLAGGAALVLDAGLAADPRSLCNLLRHMALDRGPAGPDDAYGHGEFQLPAPPTPVDATPSAFVPLDAPQRILDTRLDSQAGPAGLTGKLAAGDIRDLPVLGQAGVPATDVTAVAINVAAVELDQPGYVQALPTLRAATGGYSNVNTDRALQTRSNFAIVPVAADGTISLYSIAGGHLVVDLLGYFTGAPQPVAGGRFLELPAPQRVLDTRLDGGGPVANMVPRPVPWPAGVEQASVKALVMTVTGTEATQPGWVQAYPADRPDVVGTTSTVNLSFGESVANTVIVPARVAGVAVTGFFGTGSGHIVVDVVGYITSDTAPSGTSGRFVPVSPARAFDSRMGTGDLVVAQPVEVNASNAPGVAVPADATGVIWNVAVVNAVQPGFGRVWAADAPQPATSSFNWSTSGETRAVSVIAAVDQGRVKVVMDNGTGQPTSTAGGLLADVFGYFT